MPLQSFCQFIYTLISKIWECLWLFSTNSVFYKIFGSLPIWWLKKCYLSFFKVLLWVIYISCSSWDFNFLMVNPYEIYFREQCEKEITIFPSILHNRETSSILSLSIWKTPSFWMLLSFVAVFCPTQYQHLYDFKDCSTRLFQYLLGQFFLSSLPSLKLFFDSLPFVIPSAS